MFRYIITFLLIQCGILLAGDSYIHHQLSVRIEPGDHFLEATDTITIPAEQATADLQFLMFADLDVQSATEGVTVKLLEKSILGVDAGMDMENFDASSPVRQNKYAVLFREPVQGDVVFTLKYSGTVNFSIKNTGKEYARSFSQSPGLITDEGVYLGGSTDWTPWFNDELITFDLTVDLPDSFDAVSQGKRTLHEIRDGRRLVTWSSPEPMEEVFVIAAPFTEYIFNAGAVDVMAFLRTPDENLANKYLQTTAQYLDMYRKLIGPYPYSKFALVENFWETGYGMPSFTLLGEQIIRFPFILHSSYPHELLHNYWGNSVYVDFNGGNWCEGLTAYMADHLIKEQRGQGAAYRRATLQKYTDYVNAGNDFPLKNFISRVDAPSEAVGYGKSLMLWDMLREKVGDANFVKSFQSFYRDYKFKRASYDDIRKSFESVTRLNLQPFFSQWVERTGAPELNLKNVKTTKVGKKWRLQFTIEQKQPQVFSLDIPVAISFNDTVILRKALLMESEKDYSVEFAEHPRMVQIDPQFHVFRKLHYNEIPPALSKIFGSEEILILLPSTADVEKLAVYRGLAEAWAKDPSKKITVAFDNEISELPPTSVWVFGQQNRFQNVVKKGLEDYNAELIGDNIRFGESSFNVAENSAVVAIRHPKNHKAVVVLLTATGKKAADGLSRKLPHYGGYSFLVFEGDEPTNIAKGQWPAVHSPLVAELPPLKGETADFKRELPKRKALATLEPVFSAEAMMNHVRFLAGEELQGRGLGSPGLDKAADYIAEQFEKAGLQPGGNDGYFQTWKEVVNARGDKKKVKNVIGILPGKKKEYAGQSVVVSAHYDHLGLGWPDVRKGNEGKVHPGADDNASGVAVLLELANVLGKSLTPDRTIIFVAFTAEENGLRGSKRYIKKMKKYPADKIIGVLNLDTVGRLNDKKLMVLNSSSAREWKFVFMGIGYVTGVEAEMVAQELDASDQVNFINAGVPAVQLFSGPHTDYHRPSDTADKIDVAGLVKVAAFTREGVVYLSERPKPLTFLGAQKQEASASSVKHGGRSVSTGSMPDFAYTGSGVKIASLSPGSPAEKAGLQNEDIIIKVGDLEVSNMRDYSQALKKYQPGDAAVITYLRDGKEMTTEIVFEAR